MRLFEQGPSKLSLKALITVYPLQWVEMFSSVGSVCGSSFFQVVTQTLEGDVCKCESE